MEWALRALGFFYALSGLLYARSFTKDGVLDKSLHTLKDKRQSEAERLRSYMLKAMAALTVASGVALLMLSSWIAPLMIINAAAQGFWILYSRRAFPPQDAEELLGRRRTINALIIWLLATAFALSVVWGTPSPVVSTGMANWLPPLGGLIFLVWMLLQ